jgi:uncharacterized lipoprotein YddW (UPF0748 family)
MLISPTTLAATTTMGPLLDANPKLAAIDAKGNRYLHNKSLGDYYILCPSNPRSHEILAKLMTEAVTKYPADGLQLDRIRYPSADFCYCDYCREHFQRDTGQVLSNVIPKTDLAKQFLQWKRQQNLRAVLTFEQAVHRPRRGCQYRVTFLVRTR